MVVGTERKPMPELAVLHVSGIESTDGVSPGFSTITPQGKRMDIIGVSIDVSTQAGTTPTINFGIEWSPDNVNWGDAESADAFSEIAAATPTVSKQFTVKAPYFRLVWAILPVPVPEKQTIVHNHTGGTFTLSYDTEGPSEALDWDAPKDAIGAAGLLTMDTKPSDSIAAQGKLTIIVPVTGGVYAEGKLTIVEPVTDGDTFLIDTTEYTLLDVPLAAYDVAIGVDEPATKLNIVAAINETGGIDPTQYYPGTYIHPSVSAAAFGGDECILTAKLLGTDGNAIVTTETFDDDGNIFDDTSLGTETTGVAPDTMTIDTQVYRFVLVPEQAFDIDMGASEADTKANLVAAVNASGTEGTEYYAGTTAHPTVSIAAFDVDEAILTARTPGAAGDDIVTDESFTDVGNVFDAGDLGAVTAGTDADTVTIGTTTYTFRDFPTETGDVGIGANLTASQANLVIAVASNTDVTMAAFGSNDSVITAVSTIAATGNAVVTTETFLAGTNIFDATTLGTEVLGVNGVETALERFTNTGDLTVTRNGDGDWDVEFVVGTDDVELMTGDDSGLSGGASFVIAEELKGSSAYYTFYAVAV